ncbi:hypothetical protein V6N12_039862 [Hibiscus sabdariffa]|uniref:Uncharacterized protein n=1 Tax=Hibiscus sabdariffa TaxID=183260 RepID=A0ABR2E1Y1_9ROSI
MATVPRPTTWYPTNKSKVCLQPVNTISNNAIQKTIKLSVDCSLKIRSHAQNNMQDKDNITSPLGTTILLLLLLRFLGLLQLECKALTLAGRLIKDGVVFQQNARETSVNFFKNVGLQVDTSFGITPGMRKMELVWRWINILVGVKLLRYSTGFVHRELVCVLSGP